MAIQAMAHDACGIISHGSSRIKDGSVIDPCKSAAQKRSDWRDAKNSAHGSPFFKSSGAFVIVKSWIFTPFSICFHVNGIETGAFGLARAVNTAAKLLPRAFCIQST